MKTNIVLLLVVLILSIFPRLWELESVPKMIVDEPASLKDINSLWNKLPNFYFTDFNWGFSEATLVYYPAIGLTKLFNDNPNLYFFRLTSVIFSLIALIPFYFLIKKKTNIILAFCATLLFAFSYYYLQFSRVGWQIVYVVSLGLYLLWFLQLAIDHLRPYWFIFPGIIAGLIMYGYRAGEVYVGAGFVYLVCHLIKIKITINIKFLYFFIFLAGFLITSLPWFLKIIPNWELYNLRQRVVSVFNTKPYHGMVNTTEIIKYQIMITARSWVLLEPIDGGGDETPRYLPLVNPPVNTVIRILFILGLLVSLKKLKIYYPWWTIFVFGLIFGQILTVDPPNGARALIILPIIYFFAALGLEKIYRLYPKRLLLFIIIIITLLTAYHDFTYYQHWMTNFLI
jgi:hypothetical protein